MNSDRKISVNLVSLTRLIGLILTLPFLLVLTACENGHYPRDWPKYYTENFNQNFEAFQKLEQMQREDIHTGLLGVSVDRQNGFPIYKNGVIESYLKQVSDKRWSEYQKLLAQASLVGFDYMSDEPKKRMLRFYSIYTVEYDNGYVYMEYPPPKYSNSMYSKCERIRPTESCYQLLRKNWYHFYERSRLEQKDAK